jgi:tetratricopeptide (TPR) repeat protein
MARASLQRKARARSLGRERPSAAPAHLDLARALERVQRRGDAIAVYEAAALSDPTSIGAHLGLARLLLETGRPTEAFQRADRALALGADSAPTWDIIAGALEALGETELAATASERTLALDPARADLHARLGRLYEALDRPFDAAACYQRAVTLDASLIDAQIALSGLFGRAGQFARARTHAEAALALAPDAQGAHQNLAAICDHEGRREEAETHRERAYRAAPLIVTRAARPLRRVLTLASAARANSPDHYLIPTARYDRLTWFIGYADEARGDPQGFDVVFNAIADADVAAPTAANAAAFLARCGRPALNAPEKIARTARHEAPRLFAGVANLVAPQTTLVRPGGEWPDLASERFWLLRPTSSHGGEHLRRLQAADIGDRLGAGDHYLTVYHDYRSADGFYRKYRVFFVDREPYPYHLAIHGDWLVHYQSSGTASRPEWIQEELHFLENPEAALGARAWRAIGEVGKRLDLDFAGVDFAVLPDGRALLFEANATMYVHPEPPDSALAHKNPFAQRILEAFWTRLENA